MLNLWLNRECTKHFGRKKHLYNKTKRTDFRYRLVSIQICKSKITKNNFLRYVILKDVSNANYLGVTANTILLQKRHIDEV